MKKTLLLGLALLVGVSLTGCGEKEAVTANGQFVKGDLKAIVEVTYNSDKTIKSVTLDETSKIIGETKPENFDTELANLLLSFANLTNEEVLAVDTSDDKLGYITTIDMIDNADEASVCVLNAVKNSITGEEVTLAGKAGARIDGGVVKAYVDVNYTEDGKIEEITVKDNSVLYTTEEKPADFDTKLATFLASFKGKTEKAILDIDVTKDITEVTLMTGHESVSKVVIMAIQEAMTIAAA